MENSGRKAESKRTREQEAKRAREQRAESKRASIEKRDTNAPISR